MSWMESIAACDSREEAREKFTEWCEMKQEVHDNIWFEGRQNDVATLSVDTRRGDYTARNLAVTYAVGGKTPVRIIEMYATEGNKIVFDFLLAELRTESDS